MTIGNQAYDLGLTKKYKWAGDGAIAESTNLPALGNKIEGFVGINRYIPVLGRAAQHAGAQEVLRRVESAAGARSIPSGPLPDRYVQSNYEAMNALKIGMEKSKFRGREDTMKLIEALGRPADESEGDDFPTGRQAAPQGRSPGTSVCKFIFEMKDGKTSHHRDDPGGQDLLPAGLQVCLDVSVDDSPLSNCPPRPTRPGSAR